MPNTHLQTQAAPLAAAAHPAPACTAADATLSSKLLATLRARAALIGYSLCTITETDGLCFYLLGRWGMTRTLPDLAAVAVFLRQVGAPE